jgi:hypothetical protein
MLPLPLEQAQGSMQTEMNTAQSVLEHHLKCFGACDLDGIVSDYASDAVVFTPTETHQGMAAIKAWFQSLFVEFSKPGKSFAMKRQAVEGDYAYIVWTAGTADNLYEFATDTFVIRDSKILAQSFAAKVTPK